MKKLLYIGNKLSVHGNNPTAIEVLGPLLESEGFAVVYASSQKSKLFRLAEMLYVTVRQSRSIDYVLIDTYSTSNFWYALSVSQLCRLLELKYIPILHGGALPRRLKSNPILSKLVFANSLVNVAPSKYLVEEFGKSGFQNVTFIPNPVDLSLFEFKNRELNPPRILWVRSLASIYNPELAIRITSLLKAEFPDVTLTMVGPDKESMLPNLQKLAAELGVTVVFTGRLERKQWADLSEDCTVFLNTTHVDNAPYSLIEAAALGLPIVSTNVGGIPYIFTNRKTAFLSDDNDAEGMAESITELLADRQLTAEVVSAAHKLSREYHWETIKDKWLRILT